jgi:hypothetical protein
MILENFKNSCIYYNELHDIHIREYYNYCLGLIRYSLSITDKDINIIFGNYYYKFNNNKRTLRAQIQFEHTLVKEGGGGLNGEPKGKIPVDDSFYHVRIADFENLNKFDIIIEYSLPNIENVASCELFKEFTSKSIYISPILYEYENVKIENRDINCVTLFYNIYVPRRKKLLDNIQLRKIESFNVTNCFSSEDIKSLYSRTKILLNIRQTEHHHTFEELRVLPALLNGVIVISEDVPLRDKIPYNEFIIWTDYNSILDVMKDVEDNYDYYWNKIFKGDKLQTVINKMKDNNYKNILNIINENTH